MFKDLLLISLATILVNNFVLAQFLGICPFLGVSKKVETALGMGMAVTFVMTMASMLTYLVQKCLLETFDMMYLQTIAFILVIACLVQFVEMVLQKVSPSLYQALGIYLPLITTNCAVLGVAISNMTKGYNFIATTVSGFSGGLSFTLAILIFAGIRENMSDVPKPLQGFPIALISAGLLALAFLGFNGLIKI